MVRPGSGRFGVGFWVGFWVGLRARDFPTERVLSRTRSARDAWRGSNKSENQKEKTNSTLTFFCGWWEYKLD
jgi:hypothetical protein